jgi:DNA-binding MarR family transcriptional regulator
MTSLSTTERDEDAPSADVDDAAARLRLSATRLARRLRQQADTGLSPSQLSALASIEGHGSLTLGTLAERERVAAPSITRVVTKLVEDGLVARATDPTDRRSTRVQVTDAGRRLLDESRQRKTAWLHGRLQQLPTDDLARLVDALDVLESLTADEVGGGSAS